MLALVVPVGVDRCALPVEVVREVMAWPPLTPLPLAPVSVVGLTNVRGAIVPVFDTGVLLGAAPGAPGTHVAVVESSLGLAGLVATALPEAVDLEQTGGVALLDVDELLAPVRVGGWSA